MKKKRWICLILSIVLLMAFIPTTASAAGSDIYEVEPNNSISLADRIYSDRSVIGTLSRYDLDYFKFTVSERSDILLIGVGGHRNVYFCIEDYTDTIIAGNYTTYYNGDYACIVDTVLEPGTYYVVVFTETYYSNDLYLFTLDITPKTTHTHSWNSGTVTTDATCVNTGIMTYTCSGCQNTKTESITALGHNYTTVVTPSTCSTEGFTTNTCTRCDDSYINNYTAKNNEHTYTNVSDTTCNECGFTRVITINRPMVDMYRMYDPNSGEHFYTGSTEERQNLINAGWNYEGIGFTFPLTTGDPVYRIYDPITGEHLYTMDVKEKDNLLSQGWNYEGIAFNSGYETEVPQFRLHNPNATRGAYHFTASIEERDHLISLGWEYQGIGWYSCGG